MFLCNKKCILEECEQKTVENMLEIIGQIVEAGNLQEPLPQAGIGVVMEKEDGNFITIVGLSERDIWRMPNALYKGNVRIIIEFPNAPTLPESP